MNISMTFRAFSLSDDAVRTPAFMDLLAEWVMKCSQFDAQDFSVTAWSCAALRIPAGPLRGGIAEHYHARPMQFAFENLANTLWAMAKCKVGKVHAIKICEFVWQALTFDTEHSRRLVVLPWSVANL
eukprot:gnl/MRDRNA2_/MRDRNA2_78058_c0_seq1.p1 gnl/MRDRNA2_/MRDRNA2_78058_c0~~gnl/MRDRNA2_/MRDRNA2_78058_c0_seq1.p1  ORF type:complete len:127 (-),score=13.54 gnl/MRDRNA2_/MRDRNA2_78058_c0_seq1:44-424(-)